MSDRKPQLKIYSSVLLALLTVAALAGCRELEPGEDAGTGTIIAEVVVAPPPTALGETELTRPSATNFITSVSSFRATVTGPGMTTLTATFAGSTTSGQVDAVPAGANRTLKIEGLNAASTVVLTGQVSGLTVTSGVVTNAGTVTLTLVGPRGTVTGTVADSISAPLQGVTVSVASDSSVSTTTDSSGQFTLSDVPTGSQTLNFSLSGYDANTAPVTVVDGSSVSVGQITLLRTTQTTWLVVGSTGIAFSNAAAALGASVTTTSDFANESLTGVGALVFLGSSASSVGSTNASKISTFVSAGGGLYVEVSVDYSWVPTSGVTSTTAGGASGAESIGIAATTHAIASGVTDSGLDNWGQSSHNDFSATGGLTSVFVNDDTGLPVLIAGSFSSGRVVYAGLHTAAHSGTGDSQLVLKNIMAFIDQL